MLLRACSLLDGSGLSLAQDFSGRRAAAGRLSRALSRSPLAEAIPDAAEYLNWFLAAEVRHYFTTLNLVFGQRDFLRDCYRLCAELEADVALAHHLRSTPVWCWADRSGQRTPCWAARVCISPSSRARALLASHGFDTAVQRKAERVAAWLAGQRHAEDGAGVLADGDGERRSALSG